MGVRLSTDFKKENVQYEKQKCQYDQTNKEIEQRQRKQIMRNTWRREWADLLYANDY